MVIFPAVAPLTVAGFPAPKSTMSSAAVAEKLVPVIVTLFPPAGTPGTGLMAVMVGVPAAAAVPTLTNANAAPMVPRQRASATRPLTNPKFRHNGVRPRLCHSDPPPDLPALPAPPTPHGTAVFLLPAASIGTSGHT